MTLQRRGVRIEILRILARWVGLTLINMVGGKRITVCSGGGDVAGSGGGGGAPVGIAGGGSATDIGGVAAGIGGAADIDGGGVGECWVTED
ncbi:hypothetical protein Tco_1431608 [Tanacetum coccineum]